MPASGHAHQSLFDEGRFTGYTIRIDAFEGPLDLLLHLIRKNEVEICDIPIAVITRQYLEYLDLMKELNLEIAGEFLVMASTLLQIKSKMLLPAVEEDESAEEEAEDPRAELIRRLLEYRKYKDAAAVLEARELLGRDVFARASAMLEEIEPHREEPPLEFNLLELIEAFRKVLATVPFERFHDVISETVSVAERIGRILDIMEERESVRFEDIFSGEPLTRELVIATFLALLELCRLKTIRIAQAEPFGSIRLVRDPDSNGNDGTDERDQL